MLKFRIARMGVTIIGLFLFCSFTEQKADLNTVQVKIDFPYEAMWGDYAGIKERNHAKTYSYSATTPNVIFYDDNNISPFDSLLRNAAIDLGWDWRMLASLIWNESKFDSTICSKRGAYGLMQLMPITMQAYGIEKGANVQEQLQAGVACLNSIDKMMQPYVPDSQERIKFVLASYNIGFGHVIDAIRLAKKYGDATNLWDHSIATYLLKKKDPQYYQDEVVKCGKCSGEHTIQYVQRILNTYQTYRQARG